ncbi:MAG: lipopolysaccharide biosynthesis protein RfbH [Leptospirillia bacterium]
MSDTELRRQIFDLVERYAAEAHGPRAFVPGKTPIPASGKVYGGEEMVSLVDASLDFWLTTGRYNDAFEKKLAAFVGVRHALTTNSGSSANLLAVAALTSPLLEERALKPGDEVITVAAGFPTTVNPIIQHGCVPVFVDVSLPTYNIDVDQLEAARSGRTRAIVLAHTLGNPFDLDTLEAFAKAHNLWLIEDCCDALGSTYRGQTVGSFGDIATCSFYPAHHITMGEGGAVLTNTPRLKRIIESFRDWGRDCYCPPGKDDTCGKRFSQQLGDLPEGYDHKYTYSHVGYNLKITDMQAAVALAQMERLTAFGERRRFNFAYLTKALAGLSDQLILPQATPGSDPSWFGYPITLREGGMKRVDLLTRLDEKKIGTRLLFAGNVTRQPYFSGVAHRVVGELTTTDTVMRDTFWIGVYPGLSTDMLDYVVEQIAAALSA